MSSGNRSVSRGSSRNALARSWSMFSRVMRRRSGASWVSKVSVPSGLASTTVSPASAGRSDIPVSTGPTCACTVPLRKMPSHAPIAATTSTAAALDAGDRMTVFSLFRKFIQFLAYLTGEAEWHM